MRIAAYKDFGGQEGVRRSSNTGLTLSAVSNSALPFNVSVRHDLRVLKRGFTLSIY